MKTRKRASISVSRETKKLLDSVKRPGQSYDGIIQELLMNWEKTQEAEGKSDP